MVHAHQEPSGLAIEHVVCRMIRVRAGSSGMANPTDMNEGTDERAGDVSMGALVTMPLHQIALRTMGREIVVGAPPLRPTTSE